MTPLLALVLALVASGERDRPVTYLASVRIPLGQDERLSAFAFDTWGVQFEAVCRIPSGWRIKAGSSATPDGTLAGEGSHGATWLGRDDVGALDGLVLVTLDGPVQLTALRDGTGIVPATFAGEATIQTADSERKQPIGAPDIRLIPAAHCP